MKKIKGLILILLCTVIMLCSCKPKNVNEGYVDDDNELISLSTDIYYGDTAYNIETDIANYFSYLQIYTACSDGYYTFIRRGTIGGNQLMFIDKESKQCLPVCSNVDCLHNNDQCDASFGEFISRVNYYKNKLYTVLIEKSVDTGEWIFSLYKISTDGSAREKMFELFSAAGDPIIPEFYIHRGYIYYQISSGEDSYLYMRKLDGEEVKLVYKVENDLSGICTPKGYGDGILFSIMDEDAKYKILYYSQQSDSLYEIADNINWSFAVAGDSVICIEENTMKKINLTDLNTEVILEEIGGNIELSSDGKYIYVDNLNMVREDDYSGRKIDVYDTSGKHLDTIDLDGQYNTADFGDKEYMIFTFNGSRICIFDKSQIGSETHAWIEIDGM